MAWLVPAAILRRFDDTKPTVLVTWFGAKGDGATDDTNAINDAVDALAVAGDGSLWFPPGTYRITQAISNPQSVPIYGARREANRGA